MPPAPRCSEVSQMGGAPRTPVSVFRPLGPSCASASRVCACHWGEHCRARPEEPSLPLLCPSLLGATWPCCPSSPGWGRGTLTWPCR